MSYRLVTQLAMDRLEAVDPAAEQVVLVCAFLAPEPVPTERFTNAAGHLPEPQGTVAADPLARGRRWPGSAGRLWPGSTSRA